MISENKLDFWLSKNYNVLFVGKHGVGKCLGRGTPILMFDGTIKKVEDIKPGEQLMGPDSTCRNVISTCKGSESLYEVIPRKGDSYVVNQSHILSLKMCSNYGGFHKNEVLNIGVTDLLKKSASFRIRAQGYRTGISFASQAVPLDPYFLGIWLGDGTSERVAITNTDAEVIKFTNNFALINNLKVMITGNSGGAKITHNLSSGRGKGMPRKGRNKVLTYLQDLNLINNKHIPNIFKINSRKNRLELLAGLLDTDGGKSNNCFEISTKYDQLAIDILFLARSLGLAAYDNPGIKYCWYKGEKRKALYHRITISGNTDEIPVKIKYKSCSSRQQVKDVLKTRIDEIKPLGVGEYFGFEIDGDKLFMLGDFTVTHNTTMIKDAFDRAGLRWKYFSAATLDPWVDVIGIPTRVKAADGTEYLDLVRPKEFAYDEVEALFFDEYNRSAKKIRNAVMELIQFKSINGKKFNNLKVVWAAINPEGEDDEYDVEALDPAQKDRFHVKVEVPYMPYAKYFTDKYGKEVSDAAISWWKELPAEIKNDVSPRRLDYAMDMYAKEGDLRDVLPNNCNISKLLITLKSGPIKKQLNTAAKNPEDAKKFISSENNYAAAISYIVKDNDYLDAYLHHTSEEKIATLLSTHKNVLEYVAKNASKHPIFGKVVTDIIAANQSKKLVKELKKLLPAQARTTITGASYGALLKNLQSYGDGNTQQRAKIYDKIEEEFPGTVTPEEAIETLNILATKVVARTQQHSIKYHYKGIHKILNACFTALAVRDNLNTVDEVIFKNNNPTWNVFNQKLSKLAIQKPQLTGV